MEKVREDFYLLLFAFIIFGVFGYGIGKIYGMSIYPDEFGYWANAAQEVGYDWREVTSLASYYSYGYSLLLLPILKFSSNGVTAYRIAICINALAQAGTLFLVKRIYVSIFPKVTRENVAMAVGMSILYPVWTFYSQMTLVESILVFFYLLGCYFLIRYLESGSAAMLTAVALLFSYMYMVHMRTIGVLIALMITILTMIWQRREERSKLLGTFLLAVAGIVFIGVGKKYVSETTYSLSDANILAANGYSGKLRLIAQVLSGERAVSFLFGCAGKLYYLFMTSFGMIMPATIFLIRQVKSLILRIYHKREAVEWSFFSLFVLLSLFGQFAVAALYMSGNERLDVIFYGRYNDFLVPLVIGFGALELLQRGNFKKNYLWGGSVACGLFYITYLALQNCMTDMIQGDFAAGINYITNDSTYTVESDFIQSFMFGMILISIVFICLYAAGKKGRTGGAITVIVILETALALMLSSKYTYRYNEVNYADIRLCEHLMQKDNPRVSYLDEGDYQYIDLVQFTLRDYPVHIIRQDEISENNDGISSTCAINWDIVQEKVGKDGYLFIRLDSTSKERLDSVFSVVEEGGHFVLLKAE